MNDVNWWLMALSFVLGLVLTTAFMVRRVKVEAPAAAVGPRVRADDEKPSKAGSSDDAAPEADESKTAVIPLAGTAADTKSTNLKKSDDAAPEADESKTAVIPLAGTAAATAAAAKSTKSPEADESKTAVIPLAGTAAATAKDEKDEKDEPYGAGSLRLAAGVAPPSDYDVKGNEDSMLYHTTESPSYQQTIAEVWFRDEDSAQRAGFARWDSNQRKTETIATVADVPPGPHGPGSAAPGADGSGPEGWTIKGNEDSMLYHTTRSPSYKRTIAEVWFRDEESAVRAGFQPWDRNRRKR